MYLRFSGLLAVLVLCSATSLGQDGFSVAGDWSGQIEVPGSPLEISVSLRFANDAWTGTIDIPLQGADDLPLDAFEIAGDKATFAIQGVPGTPTFKGTLTDDGMVLSGSFTQGGANLRFRLERAGGAVVKAKEALDGLDEFIAETMKAWGVPGLGLAIVKDDKVLVAKGFGRRDVAGDKPVTEDTIFAIGSSSKAFTALLLGMLVDDGKLDWDKPVRTWLPWLELRDRFAAEAMSPRDMVTHRSGMPRHDMVWYGREGLSRKDLVTALADLEFTASPRALFQYNNLMFAAAGFLAGEVAGSTWEELLKSRVFGPLGMTTANASMAEMKNSADAALPYDRQDEVTTLIPYRGIDAVGPAGSINASAKDMAAWLRLHVSGDKRVVSATQMVEMHRPQMVIEELPGPGQEAEVQMTSYGLGWMVEQYRGKKHVHHGGNIDGFSALVSFFPAERLGIAVLVNLDGSALPEIVARTAADRIMKLEKIDWHGRRMALRETMKAAMKEGEKNAEAERIPDTKPAHPIEDYVGEYGHPAYGVVRVTLAADGSLAAKLNSLEARLEHWHYETFHIVPTRKDYASLKMPVTFVAGPSGNVDRLEAPLEPTVKPITLTKRPPARLSDPAFLDGLVGRYKMTTAEGTELTVRKQGTDALILIVPAQPEYRLEPWRKTEFKLKDLPGYSARFLLDEAGRCTGIRLVQPNGIFDATTVKGAAFTSSSLPR